MGGWRETDKRRESRRDLYIGYTHLDLDFLVLFRCPRGAPSSSSDENIAMLGSLSLRCFAFWLNSFLIKTAVVLKVSCNV